MTYVLSDIHGDLTRFEQMLRKIEFKDTDRLYILGDIIDRGPDGIKLLKRIIRITNARVLLGNHEYMMLLAIGNCKNAAEEKLKADAGALQHWYRNGGEVTHKQLKRYKLSDRAEIFAFLNRLSLNINVEVNGVKYKLVHASPHENYYVSEWDGHYYKNRTEFAVWKRWNERELIPGGYTLIFGHTCTKHFQEGTPWRIWHSGRVNAIGIDCGCAYQASEHRRLACLRLEDMQEFYV